MTLRALVLILLAAVRPAHGDPPPDACRAVWIAAYAIAWSRQADGIGRMFWVEVAGPDALKSNDARKVWLALGPLDSAVVLALADAAYAMPRAADRGTREQAVRQFADAQEAECRPDL